jgi:hypothetical protein
MTYGRVRYGIFKNNFEDGPYVVGAGFDTDPQPWIIYSKGGVTMVYVSAKEEANRLRDEWNLKYAEWCMVKP